MRADSQNQANDSGEPLHRFLQACGQRLALPRVLKNIQMHRIAPLPYLWLKMVDFAPAEAFWRGSPCLRTSLNRMMTLDFDYTFNKLAPVRVWTY